MIGVVETTAQRLRCAAFEAAQKAAHEAVRRAGIVRSHCESCGLMEDVRLHHDSYDRPLDVLGLCRRCHASRHRALGWGVATFPDGWQVEGDHWTPPKGTPSLDDCGYRTSSALSMEIADLDEAGAEAVRDRVEKDEERKGARRRRAKARRRGVAAPLPPPPPLAPRLCVVREKETMGMFQKATKKKQKVRLAITGPAKAGKTRMALSIAKFLGKRVAVIDTERGSASKYAGEHFAPSEFDVAELRTYSPSEYRKAMREASEHDVLIIDSLSHAWMGEGGLLDQKDKKGGNSFDAWRTLTPQHNELVDSLLGFPGHLIVTMRVKQAYEVTKDSNGKTKVEKLGLAPVQRDGIEYEFDVLAEVNHEHTFTVTSSRCSALDQVSIRCPVGNEIASALLTWLDEGAVEAPPVAPEPRAVSPFKGMAVADVPDAETLKGWCAYFAKGLRKGLSEDNAEAIAALERIVARGEALSVPENVIKHWLGLELGKAA